jgi:hypothetical protein
MHIPGNRVVSGRVDGDRAPWRRGRAIHANVVDDGAAQENRCEGERRISEGAVGAGDIRNPVLGS